MTASDVLIAFSSIVTKLYIDESNWNEGNGSGVYDKNTKTSLNKFW